MLFLLILISFNSQRQQLSSQLAPMTEKDSKMFVNTLVASRFRLVDN